jgi:acetolactate synthase I/II/III large subunit
MKAAELLVQCLEHEGVRYVFGIPGEETLDLMDALVDSTITFISTRHEQGAAFMADAYGRLTGTAGVCLATLGPGATNLVTGIADANLDHAPVVAITGQAGRERIHKESHQYIDIVENFRSITKWNVRVEVGAVVPEVVRKAFKIAQAEKPGACHLELPEDVAGEQVTGIPLLAARPRRPSPDRPSLHAAARLIDGASFPLILAGNGVIRGMAAQALQRLSERVGIPVVNTFMAKGCVPADFDLSLMTIGLHARDYVACGIERADLIMAVGYDPVEYAPKFWNPDGSRRIIHIDFTPAEVDSHYQPMVEVVADVREALDLLADEVRSSKDTTAAKTLRRWIETELQAEGGDDGFPLKPQRILRDIRAVLGRNDILVSDVGAHKLWVARLFPAYAPNTVLISNGYAAMGFALPAAIAAKLVYPERQILAVSGDGGFLMNCQELETAVRLGLSLVIVILRDDSFGVVRWKQLTRFGRESGVRFWNPDLVRFAESFGAKGYRVEEPGALRPILEEACRQHGVSIVDVPVDYAENFKLAEKMGRIVCPL